MLPIYVDLFNIILDSGIIPDSWLEGIIRPIHKSGDRQNPENYRPITILSCFGRVNVILTHFILIVVIITFTAIQHYGTDCLLFCYFHRS